MTYPRYDEIRSLMTNPPELVPGWTELVKPSPPGAGATFSRVTPGQWWERYKAVAFTLTTGAAGGQRQPLLNFVDADGFTFDQIVAGTNPGANATALSFISDHTPTALTPSPTLDTQNQVAAPAAGAVIASVALPAGTYTVNWQVMLAGTVATGDQDNMQLQLGGTVLLVAQTGGGVGQNFTQETVVVDVPAAGATLSVNAIAAASAGSSYRAQIAVQLSAAMTYYGTLPELLMRPGYSLQIAVNNLQAADQISGIGLLIHRFPSDYAGGASWKDREAAERAALAEILGPG